MFLCHDKLLSIRPVFVAGCLRVVLLGGKKCLLHIGRHSLSFFAYLRVEASLYCFVFD